MPNFDVELETESKVNLDLLYPKLHFSVVTAIPVGRLAQELPAWELGVSQVIQQGGYRVVDSHVSQYVGEGPNGKETMYSLVVTMQRD